jgi:succinate-acetate transporter protein
MAHDLDANSRLSYERFREFERLMSFYPRGTVHAMNPTPLGFCAFALTLFVYSMYMAGATVPIGTSAGPAMGLALFYGGLIQLIAGLLEFRLGNNFYALTFCSYAGFWLGLGSLYVQGSFTFFYSITDTTVQAKALGVFFLGWTIFTLAMLISSIRTNIALILFFFFLMLTYILFQASYFLMINTNLQAAGGAIGIFTSAIAWFIGFASLLRRGDNSYFNLPNYSLEPKPTGTDFNRKAPVELRT